MLRASEIWDIILRRTPRRRWVLLEEIYQSVEREGLLDDEDFEPQSSSSDIPKWKRNVRNVLQYRKRIGDIKWNGKGGYFGVAAQYHLSGMASRIFWGNNI